MKKTNNSDWAKRLAKIFKVVVKGDDLGEVVEFTEMANAEFFLKCRDLISKELSSAREEGFNEAKKRYDHKRKTGQPYMTTFKTAVGDILERMDWEEQVYEIPEEKRLLPHQAVSEITKVVMETVRETENEIIEKRTSMTFFPVLLKVKILEGGGE